MQRKKSIFYHNKQVVTMDEPSKLQYSTYETPQKETFKKALWIVRALKLDVGIFVSMFTCRNNVFHIEMHQSLHIMLPFVTIY